jgi:hypothetical protein
VAFGKSIDKNGDYIRKWFPPFKDFPAKYFYESWDAPIAIQKQFVIVGDNYPEPIADHKAASKDNMARMKEAYDARRTQPMPDSPAGRQCTCQQATRKPSRLGKLNYMRVHIL